MGLLRNASKLSFSGLTGESRSFYRRAFRFLDSRFRGNDGSNVFRNSPYIELTLFYGMGKYKTLSQPLKLHKESSESRLWRDEVS